MRTTPVISALFATPLLLALSPRADTVSFHPKEGTSLAKKFTMEADFQMGDISLTQNGQDIGAMLPQDIGFSGTIVMQLVDQYVDLEENVVRELVREFKKSTSEFTAMEETESEENVSKLDGTKVRFKWNAEESSYDVTVAEGEADEKELESLDWDADYTALLPGKEVAEGDRWDVDAKSLDKVLAPGTSFEKALNSDTDGDEMAEFAKSTIIPQIEKMIQGIQAKCEFAGKRDLDGVEVGVIKFEIALDESMDLSELIQKAVELQAPEMEIEMSIDEASLAVKATGKGELLWNLAAGHAQAFDLDTDLAVEIVLTMSIDAQGQTVDMDGSADMSGTVKWSMELE